MSFSLSQVSYYGQAIGLVVADTQRHADEAAKLVNVRHRDRDSRDRDSEERAMRKKRDMNACIVIMTSSLRWFPLVTSGFYPINAVRISTSVPGSTPVTIPAGTVRR